MGDSSASVRLGGIYALYDLALSNPEKRLKNIIEILSAHVRTTTQEDEYQKKYKTKPSNEISSLLKLLSDLNTNYLSENKKLFENEKLSENEEEKWYPLDLSHAYLCGVILWKLDFRKALFIGSHFEGAMLYRSHFAGANLSVSHFEGAYFPRSYFAGANLYGSHFEGAHLKRSYFEGANLSYSFFTGAELEVSYFEGANLRNSHFEGAMLHQSHFAGANLYRSHFEGAIFQKSHFEGVYGDQDEDIDNYKFKKRIEKRIGKEAEIKGNAFFAGGIIGENIKHLEKITKNTLPHFFNPDMANSFKIRMNLAIKALEQHQDQPISREFPDHFKEDNLLGELTKERADEIIQKYEKAKKKYK